MAAMVINELLWIKPDLFNGKQPKTEQQYREQVQAVAGSKAFQDALPDNLNKESLRDFAVKSDAPKELLQKFQLNKAKEIEERKKAEEAAKEKELPQGRNRSKSVHQKRPKAGEIEPLDGKEAMEAQIKAEQSKLTKSVLGFGK